jgi:hypothetical protein
MDIRFMTIWFCENVFVREIVFVKEIGLFGDGPRARAGKVTYWKGLFCRNNYFVETTGLLGTVMRHSYQVDKESGVRYVPVGNVL